MYLNHLPSDKKVEAIINGFWIPVLFHLIGPRKGIMKYIKYV